MKTGTGTLLQGSPGCATDELVLQGSYVPAPSLPFRSAQLSAGCAGQLGSRGKDTKHSTENVHQNGAHGLYLMEVRVLVGR